MVVVVTYLNGWMWVVVLLAKKDRQSLIIIRGKRYKIKLDLRYKRKH
jgi:hypothetical protein